VPQHNPRGPQQFHAVTLVPHGRAAPAHRRHLVSPAPRPSKLTAARHGAEHVDCDARPMRGLPALVHESMRLLNEDHG